MDKGTCIIVECGEPVKSREMCRKHYLQWWRREGVPDPYVGQQCLTSDCESQAGKRSGYCRPCYLRRYEAENADRIKARLKADAPRIRKREALKARRWRAANPEAAKAAQARYRRANPELVKANQQRYRQSPQGRIKNRQKAQRRRVLLRELPAGSVDLVAVIAEHGMFCHICSMVIVDESDLHFDHVIPLALGGPHLASNIKPAHAICNLRKGARVA